MKNSLLLIITILFVSFSSLLFGQNIEGQILGLETKEGIEYVNVYVEKQDIGTISDNQGLFKLNLTLAHNQNDTIKFSKVGYQTKKITYQSFSENNYTVWLKVNIDTIREVIVHSDRLNSNLKYKKVASLQKGTYSFGSAMINQNIYIVGGDRSILNISKTGSLGDASLQNKEMTVQDLQRGIFRTTSTDYHDFSDQIYVFSVETNSCSSLPIKITNRANHNVIPFENRIFIHGGKTMPKNKKHQYLCKTTEVIDVNKNEKTTYKMNPHQSANFASVLYHNHLIVMGGSIKKDKDGTKTYSNQSHFLNLKTGDWFELPDLSTAKETKAAIIGNKIFLIGGFNEKPLSTIETFDMISGKWENVGNLPITIANPALTTHGNTIYIFDDYLLLAYDTMSKSIREYKINLHLLNAQIHYYNNNLIILGGYNKNNTSSIPSSAIYKIDLNELNNTKSKQNKIVQAN